MVEKQVSLTIDLKTVFKDSQEVYKTAPFSSAAKPKLVEVVNPARGLSWFLLILCQNYLSQSLYSLILSFFIGQTNLKSPQDIQVYAVNSNFTLRWNYTGDGTNVTFSAQYQCFDNLQTDQPEWRELSGCQNVSHTECDFSSSITAYYDVHHVRIRAERREDKSPWSSIFEMIPYEIAHIGPPEIALQSINGAIKIKVSPPEANEVRKMWLNPLKFTYYVVIWENSSNVEEVRIQKILPMDIIDGLAPETTYCLKVQATIFLDSREGLFSPIHCIKTTRKVNDLLCPTNVRVFALNMKFSLLWNNHYKEHVNYTVQHLPGFLKHLYDDYSSKWRKVSGCENITDMKCNLSSVIESLSGFHYFRVQAMNENNKSCLSKDVKVDPLVTNEIGPPDIKVDISDVLLHVKITPPGSPENEIMSDLYDLSYQILYWKNSSDNEEEVKTKETKQTIATISDLTPSTLYCVKVQAFSKSYNKSSDFSKEECIGTPGGKGLPLIILATFVGALFAVLIVASLVIFFMYQAYNKIKYMFFPSCRTPLNIEGFGGQLVSSPYVPAAEEPVEICYIIESSITEEVNQIDFKDNRHFKQSSRDSGNYSYDDNTSQSKGSEETLGKDIL
ncbi:interferon alpha/beta receptor 1 [Meleagris gallopavo]|uniref:interferon alpha/beta receptor 1 n=1 Tax=Meleagris gallopavo TaxID=9103 RepID=UPI0012AC51F6|nr:interferon alpha/beta receptor 1 [Meleagris gallopavo]